MAHTVTKVFSKGSGMILIGLDALANEASYVLNLPEKALNVIVQMQSSTGVVLDILDDWEITFTARVMSEVDKYKMVTPPTLTLKNTSGSAFTGTAVIKVIVA